MSKLSNNFGSMLLLVTKVVLKQKYIYKLQRKIQTTNCMNYIFSTYNILKKIEIYLDNFTIFHRLWTK